MEIKIDKLTVGYKKYQYQNILINDFDLSFKYNGFYCLLGLSGLGKSSLVSTILGFNSPIKGKIYYDDVDLFSLTTHSKNKLKNRYIFFVPSYDILFPNLNIKENINAYNVDLDQFKNEISQFFDAETYLSKFPDEISNGESKIISIIIGILQNKEYFIIDEPTSDLDKINTFKIFNLLKRYSSNHKVFIISHDSNYVNEYADFIFKLEDKKINVLKETETNITTKDNTPIKKTRTLKSLIKTCISHHYFILTDILFSLLIFLGFSFLSLDLQLLFTDFGAINQDIFDSIKGLRLTYEILYGTFFTLAILFMLYFRNVKYKKKKNIYSLQRTLNLSIFEEILVSLTITFPLNFSLLLFSFIGTPLIIFYLPFYINKEFYKMFESSLDIKYSLLTIAGLFIIILLVNIIDEIYLSFFKKEKNAFKEEN